MAIAKNVREILSKSRGEVRRYSLINVTDEGGGSYWTPLEILNCKGDRIVKISKVQASINLNPSAACYLCVFIFQGDDPPIEPVNLFNTTVCYMSYYWPLLPASADPSGAVGIVNVEKIKAFCKPGQSMVVGIGATGSEALNGPASIEFEVQRIEHDEY